MNISPRAPGGHLEPPQDLTPYQQSIVSVVEAIVAGEVMTYGEVAAEAGRPGSAQAVANVLRRVPGLPWWRVIPASGRLYRTHSPLQQPLLEAEGWTIEDRRLVT